MPHVVNLPVKYWTAHVEARCSATRYKGHDELRILILLTLVFLVACTSTPDRSKESSRKAAETNTALGRNYMDRGKYEIALEKLKRAVAFDKTYAPAHTLLGVLYETIGETKEAGKEYKLALNYAPKNGDVNNNYGAFLCATGKPAEADKYFLAALEDPFYGTPAIALANAGSCAMETGDLDKAETYLRQSLDYDNQLGSALLPMADLSFINGEYLKARAFLQRFQAQGIMNEESLALGYQIETQLGDEKSANKYRLELQKRYPEYVPADEPVRQEGT
jgi:type IV pilus assembly protein PilF